jgi:hypothetical protein
MSNYDMIKKEAHNVYALCGTHTNSIAWREKKHYSNDAESKITRDIKTRSA